MIKRTITFGMLMMGLLFLSSCSHRLTGTWTIERFQDGAPEEQGYELSHIGTITFKKNGLGEKNLNYSVMGTPYIDQLPFNWSATDNSVTIQGERTALSKTWIITTNKRNFQQWKSTDGSNKVQVLELKK